MLIVATKNTSKIWSMKVSFPLVSRIQLALLIFNCTIDIQPSLYNFLCDKFSVWSLESIGDVVVDSC